ncbi:MAG: type VI secretion system baseplate subunit TssF [Fibrobacterales bacterium]
MADFLHYYQEELRYLSDSGKEFADRYPDVAHYLNMSANEDRDPYVERLFQGFAFLGSRIQEKLHDDFPEITHNVMEMVAPDYLRAFPSIALVEFNSPRGMLPQSSTIVKGTEILSNPKPGVPKPCKFQTTQEVEIHPLQLKQTTVEHSALHGSEIKLSFEIEETVEPADLLLEHLDLYLSGEDDIAWSLHYFLTNSITEVIYNGEGKTEIFTQNCTVVPTLNLMTKILPEKSSIFSNSHLLREYFCAIEKFRFVRVNNLNCVKRLNSARSFTLTFRFSENLPDSIVRKISNEHFKLYCTPVVNIFEHDVDPITINNKHFEYIIYPDNNNDKEVYSIIDVSGRGKAAHEVFRAYEPYHNFRHASASKGTAAQGFTYAIKQEEKRGGGKNSLITIDRHGGIRHYKDEFLSIKAYCTNGLLPREKLMQKDICNPVPGFPDFFKFSNFTRPTPVIPSVQEKHYYWKILNQFNMNIKTLCNVNTFKEVLDLYAWGVNEKQRKCIDTIDTVECSQEAFFDKGHFVRGTKVMLSLVDPQCQRSSYETLSQYRLLGEVLNLFIKNFVSASYFVSLTVMVKPVMIEFEWQPGRALCHTI